MIPLTELSLPLSPTPGLKSDLQDGVEGTESESEVASIAEGGDLPELIFGKTQIGAAAAQERDRGTGSCRPRPSPTSRRIMHSSRELREIHVDRDRGEMEREIQ